MRGRQLRDPGRCCSRANRDTEAENEATTHEHRAVLGRSDNRGTDEDDYAADDHTRATTESLAGRTREKGTSTLSNDIDEEDCDKQRKLELFSWQSLAHSPIPVLAPVSLYPKKS